LQQKKGHDFQDKEAARKPRQPAEEEIRTVRIWNSRAYCSVSAYTAARKPRQGGRIYSSVQLYGGRTAAANFWAHFSKFRTVRTVRTSVRYGCFCTENEGTVVVIFPVKFMHEFRGRDKYTVGLNSADVISRFEEIRRTPSLSLVFPTLGFFQGRFDQKFIVSFNVCLLS
jgi:hypothetical protein